LVENFRPGVMEKWGLGPADLNPQLVYTRISGGAAGEDFGGREAAMWMGWAGCAVWQRRAGDMKGIHTWQG
jgi:crotonobetainyl-CoA:carnitine CoA-transferase CaiB-like acyl-CoA transferase